MKVAGAQMDMVWHDRDANHAKAKQMAAMAKEQGADLFVLPEMFSTGFSMETSLTGESLDGPTPSLIRSLAREWEMAVVGGFALSKKDRGPQNVALAVDRNGKDVALYAKIHQIALLREDRFYEPGDRPVTFKLNAFKSACFICYDLRFPELFRAVAKACGLILVIASWPRDRQNHWDLLLQSRAVENQCYVVGVNRVGEGDGLVFTGGSAVIDPMGEILVQGDTEETLVLADLDSEKVVETRTTMPFLKDIKPNLLGNI